MQADFKPTYQKTQYSNKDKGVLRKKLLLFVEDCLSHFRNIYLNQLGIDERILNQRLLSIFDNKSRSLGLPFLFRPDYIDELKHFENKKKDKKGTDRNVDYGVCLVCGYYTNKLFYAIEAKRLRLPTSKSKQYVFGERGGIERFKKKHHGIGLKESALVGYVEEETFDFWKEKINSWIEDLMRSPNKKITWDKNDILREEYKNNNLMKLKSLNGVGVSSIKLFHYWIKLFDDK